MQPASLVANVQPGSATTLSFRATAKSIDRFDGDPFVKVVDPKGVLTGSVESALVDPTTVTATVHARGSLEQGEHSGALSVLVCRDPDCNTPYPGFPVPVPYTFSVARDALAAAPQSPMEAVSVSGMTEPTPVNVLVTGSGQAWTARSESNWRVVDSGEGRGSGFFTVRYLPQGLADGVHSASVTVRAADGQTVRLTFVLTVLTTPQARPTPIGESLRFVGINGAPQAAKSIVYDPGSPTARWTVIPNARWLTATPSSGVGAAAILIRPDPDLASLQSGDHLSTITIGGAGVPARNVTVQLTLTPPMLSALPDVVTLGGPKGRTANPFNGGLTLGTGARQWPYTVSAPPAWLLVGPTSPGLDAQQFTALALTPITTNATPGSRTAVLSVTASVNGDRVTRPVTVNLDLDQRRVLASEWGIAFATAPSRALLSRTISLEDNFTGTAPEGLSASSDVPWLAATVGRGADGKGVLTVTAAPGSVPAQTLTGGTVTVRSSTPGMQPAIVRVTLDTSSAALASMQSMAQSYVELIADPIRPFVYAHAGGGTIDVWDTRTAQRLSTITGAGRTLGRMAVSPDGSRLHAIDTGSGQLSVVDLATYATSAWVLSGSVEASTNVLVLRPNGVEVVLLGNGAAFTDGRSLGSTPVRGVMSASPDGRRVFTSDVGLSPSTPSAYDVDFSAIAGGSLSVAWTASSAWVNGASDGRDMAFDSLSARVIVASASPSQCEAVNPSALSSRTVLGVATWAFPVAVEVTRDGLVLCGMSGSPSGRDVLIYGRDGTERAVIDIPGGGVLERQMVVSPDGATMVVLGSGGNIVFVPIGQ